MHMESQIPRPSKPRVRSSKWLAPDQRLTIYEYSIKNRGLDDQLTLLNEVCKSFSHGLRAIQRLENIDAGLRGHRIRFHRHHLRRKGLATLEDREDSQRSKRTPVEPEIEP